MLDVAMASPIVRPSWHFPSPRGVRPLTGILLCGAGTLDYAESHLDAPQAGGVNCPMHVGRNGNDYSPLRGVFRHVPDGWSKAIPIKQALLTYDPLPSANIAGATVLLVGTKGGSMHSATKIPHFELSIFPHDKFSLDRDCIRADGEFFERVNRKKIYHIIGYTKDMERADITPDEFIRDRYLKDVRFASCLQVLLMLYLNRCSQRFRELYGAQYERMAHDHALICQASAAVCEGCALNPHRQFVT